MTKIYFLAILGSLVLFACSDGADGKNGVNGADGADGKDGTEGTSCVMKPLTDSTGFKVLCGEDSIGVVLNGTKGDKGDDGDDGTSCVTSPIKNGYKILCDGDSVGVLIHGKKGDSGEKGDDCSLEDVSDESGRNGVQITCGEDVKIIWAGMDGEDGRDIYMCGIQKYSIETHFCYGVTLYELCDGSVYEPTQYKCEDGNLVVK